MSNTNQRGFQPFSSAPRLYRIPSYDLKTKHSETPGHFNWTSSGGQTRVLSVCNRVPTTVVVLFIWSPFQQEDKLVLHMFCLDIMFPQCKEAKSGCACFSVRVKTRGFHAGGVQLSYFIFPYIFHRCPAHAPVSIILL